MGQEFDLWGDPIPPREERRGRPAHEVTDEKRKRIKVLRALNKTNDEIAAAMGISERTLRTKYLPELRGGLAQLRAEALVRLWTLAEAGNVSALKEFLRQTERADLAAPQPTTRAPAARLGKKDQAMADAALPDTSTSMGELMAQRAARLN